MCQPLVTVDAVDRDTWKEANVVHYPSGIAHRLQCSTLGLYVAQQYYAHRTIPAVLVQDMKITNPNDDPTEVKLEQRGVLHWPTAVSHKIR
jgi:hypothetical protein